MSSMHRTLSMRLALPLHRQSGSQGLRTGGTVLAAIPELLGTLLRALSSGAVQVGPCRAAAML